MFPQTVAIATETTHCSLGGKVVPLQFFQELKVLAEKYSIPVHLDGARMFNAGMWIIFCSVCYNSFLF